MEIAVAAVISLDGKLTRHNEPNFQAWASKEDQQFFYNLLKEYDSVVMGSSTYSHVKGSLILKADRRRIILTGRPQSYEKSAIPGKLEFTDETPRELVARLENSGHKKLLIVGGPRMITGFLKARLVNKFYLTIEPRLFGQGTPLLADLPVDIRLQLKKQQQLNPQGTLLLTYAVVKFNHVN